jgi:hypothetical protein
MQELSTRASGHEFSVDGVKLFLPPLSLSDVMTVQGFASLPNSEQAAGMADLLASRAVRVQRWRFWSDAARLVRSLGIAQQSALFQAWAAAGGIGVGESKSSGN